jgi:hypothetical protein
LLLLCCNSVVLYSFINLELANILKSVINSFVRLQFELKEELSRQQTEIRDLKARLLMGQEEYKAKYVEVLSLQDALKKLKKNGLYKLMSC